MSFEKSKYFNKRIFDYEDLDGGIWSAINVITRHFKMSKKPKYYIDLRDSHDFFYDGTWLYDIICEDLWLGEDYDFNKTIEYFEKTYGFYEFIESEGTKVIFHRAKKTPEEILEYIDIAWSDGSWTSDRETLTLQRYPEK